MSSVRNIQNWMNSYPRKILQRKAPLVVLINDLGDDFHLIDFLEVK